MALSRLRLRLTAWFGGVFLVGLCATNAALYLYLGRSAGARLTSEMLATATGLAEAIGREEQDPPGKPWTQSSADAIEEWPPGPDALAVLDSAGRIVAHRGPLKILVSGAAGAPASADRVWDIRAEATGGTRLAVVRDSGHPGMRIVVARSTSALAAEKEVLADWLLISAPVVVVLSLLAGYFLARRALRPVADISEAIGALGPEALDRRLPVRQPPDELDRLSERFNGLLDRLGRSRAANRRFLARMAHQLRTPLTVVSGESELGLERPRPLAEHVKILERIQLAARQMAHRVNELSLLAQAELGEQPPLDDTIEIDGLVLEATDLMRGRASVTRHTLELGEVEPVALRGNEALLREAVVELLENACRHAEPGSTIVISAHRQDDRAALSVRSSGPAVPANLLEESGSPEDGRSGLGLSIVRWIAAVHGGRLEYRYREGANVFVLELPAAGLSGQDGAFR